MIEALLILRKYWFVGVIVALLFTVLAMRATISGKTEELATRTAQVKDLTAANENAAKTINNMVANRVDNDAIADLVAAKIKVSNVHETNYRTIIERASNDPAVRAWLSEPVPSVVRGALSTNQPVTSAR